MSFFSTASLVLISDFAAASASVVSGSGTNTGKAYSVKPTDGSGDFVFERGSDITATRVNSSGLIEKGRGNLLKYSEEFDNPYYLKLLGTLTTNQTTAPDGSLTADLFTKTSRVDTVSGLRANGVYSSTGIFTFSIYVKQNVGDDVLLRLDAAGNTANASFQFSTKSISTQGSNVIDATATELANGWFRLSLTGNVTNTSWGLSIANLFSNPTNDSIFVWGAQLEQGLVATDYIETTTAPLRAGLLEDEPRFDYHNSASASPNTCPSLLLEPSRTNFITNSEYLTGASQITSQINNSLSPEGKTNATLIQGDGTTVQPRYPENVTTTAGENILSVFAKSGNNDFIALGFQSYTGGSGTAYSFFDLANGTTPTAGAKIENYGNGWYRCISPPYTVDAGDTSGINTVFLIPSTSSLNFSSAAEANGKNVSIYGMQVEQGSYPTSYIPTYGTAATRGAEGQLYSGFSSLIGQTEGTLFLDIDSAENSTEVFSLNRSTTNSIFLDTNSNFYRVFTWADGSTNSQPTTIANTDRIKIAIAYKSNDFAIYANGSQVSTNNTLTWTPNITIDTLNFNVGGYVANKGVARYNQVMLIPERLSNTDCEILTGATTYSSFAAMASALNYTVYE